MGCAILTAQYDERGDASVKIEYASLSAEALELLHKAEAEIKAKTGEDIILVAFSQGEDE